MKFAISGILLAVISGGCGQGSVLLASPDETDIFSQDGALPFDGQAIKFRSTYVYFPSDFAMAVVRDTMPQEDACRLLRQYARSQPRQPGLPVLPYEQEHYTLVINIDSVQKGDEVSIDPQNPGGTADMRYAVLGRFPVGKNSTPLLYWKALGVIRIADLVQYQHVRGSFSLQFPAGDHIEESFDIAACQ